MRGQQYIAIHLPKRGSKPDARCKTIGLLTRVISRFVVFVGLTVFIVVLLRML